MNAPDKCPKCGADLMMQSSGGYFRCGTWATVCGTVDQSRDCTSYERDQLLVEVEKIKEERNRAGQATRNELIPKLQKLKDENAALKKWIADLDEIGRHSGNSEHREWHGQIGWLLRGQVAYVGEAKP